MLGWIDKVGGLPARNVKFDIGASKYARCPQGLKCNEIACTIDLHFTYGRQTDTCSWNSALGPGFIYLWGMYVSFKKINALYRFPLKPFQQILAVDKVSAIIVLQHQIFRIFAELHGVPSHSRQWLLQPSNSGRGCKTLTQ